MIKTRTARPSPTLNPPREVCEKINLGYRDPATINVEEFVNREDEGIFYVERAGELLYRPEDEPQWARVNG